MTHRGHGNGPVPVRGLEAPGTPGLRGRARGLEGRVHIQVLSPRLRRPGGVQCDGRGKGRGGERTERGGEVPDDIIVTRYCRR